VRFNVGEQLVTIVSFKADDPEMETRFYNIEKLIAAMMADAPPPAPSPPSTFNNPPPTPKSIEQSTIDEVVKAITAAINQSEHPSFDAPPTGRVDSVGQVLIVRDSEAHLALVEKTLSDLEKKHAK
jgi:hypothetical protein